MPHYNLSTARGHARRGSKRALCASHEKPPRPALGPQRVAPGTRSHSHRPTTGRMRQFKWIEWNLQKIDAHALSAEKVEAAFDHVFSLEERKDSSYQMFAQTPSGAGSG